MPDSAFTASSQRNERLGPEKSRITNPGTGGKFWLAARRQFDDAWIQV